MRNRCVKCSGLSEELPEHIKDGLPHCNCGGLLRPDVVWFGEVLPERMLELSFDASKNCDVFFSIGTSAVVQPAASLPLVAKENGAMTIEINTEKTSISNTSEILRQLVTKLGI